MKKTHLSNLRTIVLFYKSLVDDGILSAESAGHRRYVQLKMRLNRRVKGYNETGSV